MRGDRPCSKVMVEIWQRFTPHARGSTPYPYKDYDLPTVYPACAGIDLYQRPDGTWARGLPRMRGDRPGLLLLSGTSKRFTPHARGST